MLKKVSLKKIKKNFLQEKITNIKKLFLRPSSASPKKKKKELCQAYSEYSNNAIKPKPRKAAQKTDEKASFSKLSILNTPKKQLSRSPVPKPIKPLENSALRNTQSAKKLRKIDIIAPKIIEKVYKVSITSSLFSTRSVTYSSKDQNTSRSHQEYIPDFKYPKTSIAVSHSLKNEEYNLQYFFNGHKNIVNSIAISNKNLFTGSSDYSVKKWKILPTSNDPYKGKNYLLGQVFCENEEVIKHKKLVFSVEAKENMLFSASVDGTVKILRPKNPAFIVKNSETPKCFKTFDDFFCVGGCEKIFFYDLQTLVQKFFWSDKNFCNLAKQDNFSLFSGHLDGFVKL